MAYLKWSSQFHYSSRQWMFYKENIKYSNLCCISSFLNKKFTVLKNNRMETRSSIKTHHTATSSLHTIIFLDVFRVFSITYHFSALHFGQASFENSFSSSFILILLLPLFKRLKCIRKSDLIQCMQNKSL